MNAATWCSFARDCMRVLCQMSRTVETYNNRGCENISLTNTQDILNVPIGNLLADEQSEEPSDEWKSHVTREEPVGSMLTASVSSQTQVSAQVHAHWILTLPLKLEQAEAVTKSKNYKNGTCVWQHCTSLHVQRHIQLGKSESAR